MEEENLTPSSAIALVSAYFPQEWPQTPAQDIQLRKITGGFVNRLHLITRPSSSSSSADQQEPSSILIRHFGREGSTRQQPLASSTTLSAAEQALIYHEMGRRGWGPRVYGVFDGGRLEEWVDAHPLTAAEARATEGQLGVERDVARAYARLHSLDLPFRKGNFRGMVRELAKTAERNKGPISRCLLGQGHAEARELAKFIATTDWTGELEWTSSLLQKYSGEPVLVQGDTNYLNVLIKNYESDCRAMVIDYETCNYAFRGIDIGGHFNERMYCWDGIDTNMTGLDAHSVDEQREFCGAYLEERKALGMKTMSQDTVEHLLLEARVGRMWQILFSVAMGFHAEEFPDDKPLAAALSHMMATYWRLKREFEERK